MTGPSFLGEVSGFELTALCQTIVGICICFVETKESLSSTFVLYCNLALLKYFYQVFTLKNM